MKKIVILFLMLIVISLSALPALDKEQTDAWTALVGEKNLQVKMQKLEDYYNKYGEKEDRYSMYMYIHLAQTTYLLQQYEKTIQFGEKALTYSEIDASNKLPLYLYLANAYNLTKKDLDKAYGYAEKIIELAKSLRSGTQNNSAIDINYTAPALRIQVQLLAAKFQDPQSNVNALNKALEAYHLDKSEKSANIVAYLSDRLANKLDRAEDAIRGLTVINKDKPDADYFKLLGTWYARLKNNPMAIENFKESYSLKKNAQVAYNLGILLNQNQELDSALDYLAESYLLNEEKYSPEALKLLEHLVFFEKTKGQPQEEQVKVYNAIMDAAKARLGIVTTLPTEPEKKPE
jgi:tetratricopeptide (TPR) repeat protein